MKNSDLSESAGFGFLMRDVTRLLVKRFERKAGKIGLTQAQWSVLYTLSHREGINQAALAQLIDVEPITLVGLLDKLEHIGLVERRLDPDDRRARLIYLTAKAQPLIKEIHHIRSELTREAFADIPHQQQAIIMATLHQIKKNLTRTIRDNIY